ncbi:hypothetical protein [Metabacillus iocasae]|uniref:Uncharacterized protein n=1 Tax=Priestia iocasae TaxID=2291674 RepID=A0ABS2QTK1_9BACI|nr:hypothetical protein [Metabacillus iocasae]MBM7702791.1 hypothetical protein [Metabacillus iocasae]
MSTIQLEQIEHNIEFITFTNEDSLTLGLLLVDYAVECSKHFLEQKGLVE